MSSRRRKFFRVGGAIVALLAIAVVVLVLVPAYYRNRKEPDFAVVGPHSMPIRQLSYRAAHGKPLIQFSLPVVGEIIYPKPEYVAFMDPGVDMLAGYVVISTNRSVMVRGERSFPVVSRLVKGRREAFVPVYYANAPDRREFSVRVDRETIKIQAPYDATRLPALYSEKEERIGPLTFKVELGGVTGSDRYLRFTTRSKDRSPKVRIESPTFRMSSSGGSNFDFAAPAKVGADGSLTVEGDLYYAPDGKTEKAYPFSVVLKQKPLPKATKG